MNSFIKVSALIILLALFVLPPLQTLAVDYIPLVPCGLKAQPVDLVLLDIILPGKSGFEVLEEIKGDPQIANLPVIIISNLGQEADIEKGRGLGVVDYIVKARISIDDLIKKAKEFLR